MKKTYIILVILLPISLGLNLFLFKYATPKNEIETTKENTIEKDSSLQDIRSTHLEALDKFFVDNSNCFENERIKGQIYNYHKEKEIVPSTCLKYRVFNDSNYDTYLLTGIGAGCGGCKQKYGVLHKVAENDSVQTIQVDGYKAWFDIDENRDILIMMSNNLSKNSKVNEGRSKTEWKIYDPLKLLEINYENE